MTSYKTTTKRTHEFLDTISDEVMGKLDRFFEADPDVAYDWMLDNVWRGAWSDTSAGGLYERLGEVLRGHRIASIEARISAIDETSDSIDRCARLHGYSEIIGEENAR